MALFIKIEKFKNKTIKLTSDDISEYISEHVKWVNNLKSLGLEVSSGYLVDSDSKPGGGGLLFIKARSYQEAEKIVLTDPMIKNDLVEWTLHKWVKVSAD